MSEPTLRVFRVTYAVPRKFIWKRRTEFRNERKIDAQFCALVLALEHHVDVKDVRVLSITEQ